MKDAVTGKQVSVSTDADKGLVATTQELVSLYKREFGDTWQNVFGSTVKITVSGS